MKKLGVLMFCMLFIALPVSAQWPKTVFVEQLSATW